MSMEMPDNLIKPAEEIDPENNELAEQSLKDWFEGEFTKRETIEVSGSQVEVLDIKPKEMKHEVPVLFISGYGDGSPEGRKANVLELVKQGRRAIMIKSDHGVEQATENSDENEKIKDLPESMVKQINAIIPVLEQKGIEKVSLFGESRGGIVAAMAAYLYPEKFENLILIDPGGMVQKMNMAKLAARFIEAGLSEGKVFKEREDRGEVSDMGKEQVVWGTKNFYKWVLRSPKLSLEEVDDIAKSEIYNLLREIKNSDIGISIIHGVDDKVFPMKDVQQSIGNEIGEVKNENNAENVPEAYENIIDGFYSVQGGHGEFNTRPELYTRIAEKALTALEKKQKEEQENS